MFAVQYQNTAKDYFLDTHIASNTDPEQQMHLWSHTVEKALALTLQQMHTQDPMRYPLKNLPQKFRGRCAPPKNIVSLHPIEQSNMTLPIFLTSQVSRQLFAIVSKHARLAD